MLEYEEFFILGSWIMNSGKLYCKNVKYIFMVYKIVNNEFKYDFISSKKEKSIFKA